MNNSKYSACAFVAVLLPATALAQEVADYGNDAINIEAEREVRSDNDVNDRGGNIGEGNYEGDRSGRNSQESSRNVQLTPVQQSRQLFGTLHALQVGNQTYFVTDETLNRFSEITANLELSNQISFLMAITAVFEAVMRAAVNRFATAFNLGEILAGDDSDRNPDNLVLMLQSSDQLTQTSRDLVRALTSRELQRAQRASRSDEWFWEQMFHVFSNPRHYNDGGIQRAPNGELTFRALPASSYQNLSAANAQPIEVEALVALLRTFGRRPAFARLLRYVRWVPDLNFNQPYSAIDARLVPSSISWRDMTYINAGFQTLTCQERQSARAYWRQYARGNGVSQVFYQQIDWVIANRLTREFFEPGRARNTVGPGTTDYGSRLPRPSDLDIDPRFPACQAY